LHNLIVFNLTVEHICVRIRIAAKVWFCGQQNRT